VKQGPAYHMSGAGMRRPAVEPQGTLTRDPTKMTVASVFRCETKIMAKIKRPKQVEWAEIVRREHGQTVLECFMNHRAKIGDKEFCDAAIRLKLAPLIAPEDGDEPLSPEESREYVGDENYAGAIIMLIANIDKGPSSIN
jgi:hypothetical protein